MMDHAEATKTLAVEQYLLGQLSDADQGRFEEHFFSCLECASEIKAGSAFVANLKTVFAEPQTQVRGREPKRWFSSAWFQWAPLGAMAALLCLTAYQNTVEIPSLRARVGAEYPVLSLNVAKPVSASRAGEPVALSRALGVGSFTVLQEWDESYKRYSAELIRDGKVLADAEASGDASGLTVAIPVRSLEPDNYTLAIYGVQEGSARKAVGRIPIKVTP